LNLLRQTSGAVRVFGLDPAREEVAVKSRLAYVPDTVAFYPWMTVQDTLDYFAAFRSRWNQQTERALLDRFRLDVGQKTSHLSKGQRTQLALIAAICSEPELLVLDEPTSGLDPIVRREFIQTVIGAYQEADPGRRTVFVSTHLISEFEGLIDDFTIIDRGRDVLTMNADAAREQFQRIHARFPGEAPRFDLPGCRAVRRQGREIEVMVDGITCDAAKAVACLQADSPEELTTEALSLEEIFVTTLQPENPGGPAKAVA
jgi:ABC-2 type transport system ATP-binding protein